MLHAAFSELLSECCEKMPFLDIFLRSKASGKVASGLSLCSYYVKRSERGGICLLIAGCYKAMTQKCAHTGEPCPKRPKGEREKKKTRLTSPFVDVKSLSGGSLEGR